MTHVKEVKMLLQQFLNALEQNLHDPALRFRDIVRHDNVL